MRSGRIFYIAIFLFCLMHGSLTAVLGVDAPGWAGPVPGGPKGSDFISLPAFDKNQVGHASKGASKQDGLTPAQTHAAELLGYLMRISLGTAGDPRFRDQWRVRGLNEPLDFQNVTAVMTETDRNALDLMVLDPNILDLTTVLYYYDKQLSLYEGDYGVTSIYPAAEFIAIRLLLLKKIHRKEKVRLSALMAREDLVRNPELRPTQHDLEAMNLSAREFGFLQEIIKGKPHLLEYLKSPFLVKELDYTGALADDALVKEKISQANYRAYPCRYFQGSRQPNAVKIFLLPSMTDEFVHGRPDDPRSSDGFQPTGFLLQMLWKMVRQIEGWAKESLEKELFLEGNAGRPSGDSGWETLWSRLAGQYVGFYAADQRPVAVYPENAAQAISEMCPQADFTVIILGKNVYKSIFFEPLTDIYPAVNRIYVDIMDIKHSRTQEEVRMIGAFIGRRITDRILEEGMSPSDMK